MSALLLSETHPVARNPYNCDACEWILNSCDPSDLTFSERKTLVKARRNEFMIKKGEKYTYQALVYWGDFIVFKAITSIHLICLKYDIYDD